MDKQKMPTPFFRTMASKTKGSKNAFVARHPPSTGKMLNENVDLIIYMSE
jgi:hypothetical protein